MMLTIFTTAAIVAAIFTIKVPEASVRQSWSIGAWWAACLGVMLTAGTPSWWTLLIAVVFTAYTVWLVMAGWMAREDQKWSRKYRNETEKYDHLITLQEDIITRLESRLEDMTHARDQAVHSAEFFGKCLAETSDKNGVEVNGRVAVEFDHVREMEHFDHVFKVMLCIIDRGAIPKIINAVPEMHRGTVRDALNEAVTMMYAQQMMSEHILVSSEAHPGELAYHVVRSLGVEIGAEIAKAIGERAKEVIVQDQARRGGGFHG